MKSSLKNMVLVLFTITAISAALVALVNDVTKETIAETEKKNRDLAKLEVLPKFEGEPELKEQKYEIGDFEVNVTEVSANGAVVGYAVEAPSLTANGYADKIYLMVGFVEDEAGRTKIHGVKVLSQKETPGLGANMIKPGNKLENSVLDKYADELVFEVKKKDNPNGSFDALTGSTISSCAYANAVETAYAGYLMYRGLLLPEEESKEPETTETIEATTGAITQTGDEVATGSEDAALAAETTETTAAVDAVDAVDEQSVDVAASDATEHENDILSESATQEGDNING